MNRSIELTGKQDKNMDWSTICHEVKEIVKTVDFATPLWSAILNIYAMYVEK